jgi:hypothetical protein
MRWSGSTALRTYRDMGRRLAHMSKDKDVKLIRINPQLKISMNFTTKWKAAVQRINKNQLLEKKKAEIQLNFQLLLNKSPKTIHPRKTNLNLPL